MKISISTLLVFTLLVALQIRFLQLLSIGVLISLLVVPISFTIMMISAFGSESENGYLAVHNNSVFQFRKQILMFGFLNLFILLFLSLFFT